MAVDFGGTMNGLQIGPGTPYQIVSLQGWKKVTPAALGASGTLVAKQTRNGEFPVPFWAANRTPVIQFEIAATSSKTFPQAVADFEAATQPQGTNLIQLTIQLDGISTTLNCTIADRDEIPDLAYAQGLATASVAFHAFDPRRFGPVVSASTGLPSSSGGLTWPVSWPISWTSTITTGSVQLTNAGNAAGPLTVTFYGGSSGVSGPSIGQTESGLTLSFSSALTIQPNDQLVVDMDARTALYNGQASRANYLVSRGWQTFLPGTNTFTFNATSAFNAAPSMTASGTPAYL